MDERLDQGDVEYESGGSSTVSPWLNQGSIHTIDSPGHGHTAAGFVFFQEQVVIKLSGITKAFGATPVLHRVSFVANTGECIGVIGANGAGKTTLLRIVAGELAPDQGSVDITPGARVGYLRQGFADGCARTAGDAFRAAFSARGEGGSLESLATDIARASAPEARARLEAAYDRALSAAGADTRIADAWRDLRLRTIDAEDELSLLSGGEITKLGLVELVATMPDALLLDEPTNNLDLDALAWLDTFIAGFEGPAIIVSHDRALLDDHADALIEISATTGRTERFSGGYAEYADERARRDAEAWAAYRRQQERERRVKSEIRDIQATASRREHKSQNDFYRRKAKKVARRAVVLERRLHRELTEERRIEKPVREPYRVKAEIETEGRAGDRMLQVSDGSIAAGRTVLVDRVAFEIGWGERVVLAGPNGSGKTTLLRAIAGEQRLDGGRITNSPSTRIGYLAQEDQGGTHDAHATPLNAVRAVAAISETEARRYLHRFLFAGDDALRPVNRLSYGERKRLSLALLVLSGANLLLLDEPTNHLDIPSREAFESALDAFPGAMLVATHDRYFIERFAERMLRIENGRVREVYD